MKNLRVAINGFGRIGRCFFRANLKSKKPLNIVAINDLTDNKTLAHLLKYDSTFGVLPDKVSASNKFIKVNKDKIHALNERDPSKLPWEELGVDIVIECTGIFRETDQAQMHIDAGAKKVIISAPSKTAKMFVMGVNHKEYKKSMKIISNASCTTNSIAPVIDILHKTIGIKKGALTTTHSVTNDQRILDLPHKDLRRARSAIANIIPTSTGAATAIGKIIPTLNNKLNGDANRVPLKDVSVSDLVLDMKRETTDEEIHQIIKEASKKSMKGYIQYLEEELVSNDFIGSPYSSIVDAGFIKVIGNTLLKLKIFYDNEWGYSQRLLDLTKYISK